MRLFFSVEMVYSLRVAIVFVRHSSIAGGGNAWFDTANYDWALCEFN